MEVRNLILNIGCQNYEYLHLSKERKNEHSAIPSSER